MKRHIISAVLASIMAVSLAGCGAYESSSGTSSSGDVVTAASGTSGVTATDSSSASGEKVFRYAESTDPTTLDPDKADSIIDNEVIHATQEGLVRNTAGNVTPGIAESWDVSDDGLTYTFHLRSDAKWSDGVAVTANDFVYGLQRLMDPDTASEYAFIGEYIKNGSQVETGAMDPSELGVKATDDHTLVITLEQPTSFFLTLIGGNAAFMPVREDIVDKYGTDFAATADKSVYSGPFVISSTDNGEYVFTKNENYWDKDNIKLDRAEMMIVADASTQLAMYEQGELDYVTIPTDSVADYDDQDEEYMNGNEDFFYINENSDNPILSDKNFRLALNYGLDRNQYIKLATNDVYTASNTLVMPLVAGYDGKTYGDCYTLDSYPLDGDQDKAQEYLKKAMADNNISDPSDISVEITTTDLDSAKKIAEVCQELWQQSLGIKVTVKQVTYSDIYGSVLPNGDYEIGFGGWGPDYSDPYTYLNLFKTDCSFNYSNYSNDAFDQLLDQSQTETDEKTRMDELNKAEQLLLDDGAFIPLQCRQQHYLLSSKVSGVQFYFCSVNIDWVYADISA